MIHPQLLCDLFSETHTIIKRQTEGLTHKDSVWQPPSGVNCLNWIVGHIVVARCNFLMLLDVPSIWGGAEIRRFIPGSVPITGEDAYPFDQLVADLDRTQAQLLEALQRVSEDELRVIEGGKTIGEQLVFYHSHEAQHTGQIELLRQLMNK